MATICPKCKKENMKKGDSMVYCAGYKPKKVGDIWNNEGSCDFRINFSNKVWGQAVTPAEIKGLIEGKTINNKKGDSMVMDLTNQYFTKITFAEKEEDEDL